MHLVCAVAVPHDQLAVLGCGDQISVSLSDNSLLKLRTFYLQLLFSGEHEKDGTILIWHKLIVEGSSGGFHLDYFQ